MADLRTDYQDDVLDASENTARVYDLVDSNGKVVLAGVHLEDKTVYTTEGDDYGAADINTQNTKINQINADLTANNNKFIFAYDSTSQSYGYKAGGADTFHPFRQGQTVLKAGNVVNSATPVSITITKKCSAKIVVVLNTDYSNQSVTISGDAVLSQESTTPVAWGQRTSYCKSCMIIYSVELGEGTLNIQFSYPRANVNSFYAVISD